MITPIQLFQSPIQSSFPSNQECMAADIMLDYHSDNVKYIYNHGYIYVQVHLGVPLAHEGPY